LSTASTTATEFKHQDHIIFYIMDRNGITLKSRDSEWLEAD